MADLSTARTLDAVLLGLQAFVVVFLWIHDWVPLGPWNDVVAVRSQDSLGRLIYITIFQSVPWTIGLVYSTRYFGRLYPHWLEMWLWITYGLVLLGFVRAWWIPYFFGADTKRRERYQIMFGKTHSFLPVRNGIVLNTAHMLFGLASAGTLVVLHFRDLRV